MVFRCLQELSLMTLIKFVAFLVQNFLPKNSLKIQQPLILSVSDMTVKLLRCKNLMKVIQNEVNEFHGICSSENSAGTHFYTVSFD